MAYRFLLGEPVDAGARRIADEQIAKAIAEIADERLDPHETIHQVRKRCKKLRALLRLLRGGALKQNIYRFENAWYRDLARTMSGYRDVQALIEAYDRLMAHYAHQVERPVFAPLRRALTLRRKALSTDGGDLERRIAHAALELREARARVAGWPLPRVDVDALAPGFAKTYARCRTAAAAAAQQPDEAHLHDWRKRAKYHRYHLQLLHQSWPAIIAERREVAAALSDTLGHQRDLALLDRLLADEPDILRDPVARSTFLGLLERRRDELRAHAFTLGRRICADHPKRLSKRIATYWNAAVDEQRARA